MVYRHDVLLIRLINCIFEYSAISVSKITDDLTVRTFDGDSVRHDTGSDSEFVLGRYSEYVVFVRKQTAYCQFTSDDITTD